MSRKKKTMVEDDLDFFEMKEMVEDVDVMDIIGEEETPREMTLTACLNRIRVKIDMEGNNPPVRERLKDELALVSSHFGVSDEAAILLANIIEQTGAHNGVDEEDLAKYLGCTNIQFIAHHKFLRELELRGAIMRGNTHRGCPCYRSTPEVSKAIENEVPFTPVKMTGLTADELFSRFRRVFSDNRNNGEDAERTIERLDALVEGNQHLLFCRRVRESVLYADSCNPHKETERRFFFYLCHRYVSHGEKSVDIDQMMCLTEFMEDEQYLKRAVANERMEIQHDGLVTFGLDNGFADNESLALSDTVRTEFLQEVEVAPEEKVGHRDIVPASSITKKELFFNHVEAEQIERLGSLVEPENFKAVQARLDEVGMRRGFNALFYGGPGTGKTACAYELARRSGRDLFVVDMAKLRSKWVGESEKSVKAVFSIYRKLCRTSAEAPILLFNEADAIFGKRFENVDGSADQMNNTIQNIILQEMETLDGLLIATTNLATNLDPAFERRFIFKIEFKLPGSESRARIWKSMLTGISDADADTLAKRYEFSGGNIENIARKSTVEYVLSGRKPDLASLERYCEEETIGRKTASKIGF